MLQNNNYNQEGILKSTKTRHVQLLDQYLKFLIYSTVLLQTLPLPSYDKDIYLIKVHNWLWMQKVIRDGIHGNTHHL